MLHTPTKIEGLSRIRTCSILHPLFCIILSSYNTFLLYTDKFVQGMTEVYMHTKNNKHDNCPLRACMYKCFEYIMSSAWRQKGLTGYCFKYTDRPFCLRTNNVISDNRENISVCFHMQIIVAIVLFIYTVKPRYVGHPWDWPQVSHLASCHTS